MDPYLYAILTCMKHDQRMRGYVYYIKIIDSISSNNSIIVLALVVDVLVARYYSN